MTLTRGQLKLPGVGYTPSKWKTKQRRYHARCPHCGLYPVICEVCGTPATGATPFSDWLREVAPGLGLGSESFDAENLDYIWFQYRQGWYITIEEKQYGGHCSRAQRDTHGMVAQMLSISSGKAVETLRGKRAIEYRGHYVVIFENTTPDNSSWIRINGTKVGGYELIQLLSIGSFERG